MNSRVCARSCFISSVLQTDERSSFQLYYRLSVFAILLFAGPSLTTRSLGKSLYRLAEPCQKSTLFLSFRPSTRFPPSSPCNRDWNRSIYNSPSRGFEEKSRKLISRNDDQVREALLDHRSVGIFFLFSLKIWN